MTPFLLSQEGVEMGGGPDNTAVVFLPSIEGAVTKRTKGRSTGPKTIGSGDRVMVTICGSKIEKSLAPMCG